MNKQDQAMAGILKFFIVLVILWFISGSWTFIAVVAGIHFLLIVLSRIAGMSTLKLILLVIGLEMFLG